MTTVSFFDGLSGGQIALTQLGIIPKKYYAAEIKPHAIKVTKANFPNTIHIGDVRKVFYKDGILKTENGVFEVGKIDLLIGGSPCQDLSCMNSNQIGLAGEKSSLFWEFARIKKESSPTHFLLENVGSMPYNDAITISNEMGVEGIRINSALVSAQQRDRIYWTNIPGDCVDLFGNKKISQPIDRKISATSILESGYTDREKMLCITARSGKRWGNLFTNERYKRQETQLKLKKRYEKAFENIVFEDGYVRPLTIKEMERLQTVPEGYMKNLDWVKACDLLGDGWTIEVIKHIFKNLPQNVSL